MSNKFKFFIPGVDIVKATDKDGNEKMVFKGVASTIERDLDGQILDPSGFDLSFFKEAGFINWNHQAKNNPSAIIGEPTVAKITKDNEFYIEAELYANSELARETYELADILKKNSKARKLGWSIEGKVLEKDLLDPTKVRRSLITNVAVTPSPKNGGTWLDILKGNLVDEEYIYETEEELEKGEEGNVIAENDYKANGGTFYLIDILKPNGDRITVDTDFNIKVISKALMATEGAGAVLKKEDVETELKYPQQLVKSILVLTNAFQEGLIADDVFFNEIKPAILNKIDLLKGNKEEIIEKNELDENFNSEEEIEKANIGDPIGTIKKFKFKNTQREYEKQADGKWKMLAEKRGDSWVISKQIDKEKKKEEFFNRLKEQRIASVDNQIIKVKAKIDSFINKLPNNYGEEFDILQQKMPRDQAYYLLIGKHGEEESQSLFNQINNIDEILLEKNRFEENVEDYFHEKLAAKFPETDFEF